MKTFSKPVQDIETVKRFLEYVRGRYIFRNYLMFYIGFSTPLKASTLLSIRVEDIFVGQDSVKIQNNETCSITLKNLWNEYMKTYPTVVREESNYIFFNDRASVKGSSHISVQQLGKIIKESSGALGISNLGVESLRKTRAYQAMVKGLPLQKIQNRLGHRSLTQTLHYLGISMEQARGSGYRLS